MYDQEIQSVKQRFGIIGSSPKLNHAIQVAVQVASTDLTVLITGENGSGKESFSKIIHQLGQRKHGQFIAINCGAIPEGTIDSELFGHEKGAFTGAQEARKGYFEVTNGGTIFLDEIGEMPLKTQTRLLRVLENKEFIRVGSSTVQKTDVRVVAATNRDLIELVEKGKFREDLYYRLNTVPIIVPPLREREQDILLLFRKFSSDFAERYRVKPIMLTEEAKEIVLNFRFPGNIRQLKNLVEQISVLEIDRDIDAGTIRKYLPNDSARMMPALIPNREDDKGLNERDLLYKVLFEMRKDMTELKKMVLQMAQEGGHDTPQLIKDNRHLFNDIEDADEDDYDARPMFKGLPSVQHSSPSLPSTYMIQPSEERPENRKAVDYDKVEDIIHETEDESFSLQRQEKEMIVKALRKNNNKRKYAARDLGISERTLYRKIKQYEIED